MESEKYGHMSDSRSFHDDCHASRFDGLFDGHGNLFSEAFLNLQPPTERLGNASEL